MKRTLAIVTGIGMSFFTFQSFAQQTWDAKKNPTVDSITSRYTTKYIAPRPALTTNDIFPVIGRYESTTNPDAVSVTVTLDETNKGLVWVDGLPQGKLKAMLRKSPATYIIPVQKNAEGKHVGEGTLVFDKDTNTLSITIGQSSETKKSATPKIWKYTGVKISDATASN